MKSKFVWFGIMVFGVTLLGMPPLYAGDIESTPADLAYETAVQNRLADLEEIAANREAVIEELVQMWFMDIPGWEAEFRSLLNVANDNKLLAILNAVSYAEVQAILGGGTPAFYSADSMADPFALGDTDKDFVYTPVKPCRIVDTRKAGGKILSGWSRAYYVHGSGARMSAQGGNAAGCTSPRGEPRAVHMNIVAVNSEGSGFLTVWPIGTSRPLAGVLNYFPGRTDPVSNAFTVATTFGIGTLDIGVYAHKTTHVVADVMGYYYDAEPEKIVAAASSGTQEGGISVVGTSDTTLVSKTVTIPTDGRVLLMGEASWHNVGSSPSQLKCKFFEGVSQVDSWLWDAGDDDGFIDQHQTRFFLKTVTPGTKTYYLTCAQTEGSDATAYYRNLIVQFIEEEM